MTEQRGKWHRLLWGGTPRTPAARREMTRGEQTAWIVGAIAVVGFLGLDYARSHDPSDPYAPCRSVFAESGCKARIAMERLDRLSR